MKKILFLVAAFLAISPLNVRAAEKSGYEYEIHNNKSYITGYSGDPVYIEIPEFIDGCRVTEISDNAFFECQTLKNITIPDSVGKIGHHAFYACSSLENVIIPDSVTEIGMGCFCGDSSLVSVSLSENVSSLPESCFRSCTSLKNVFFPDAVTEIGDFCFSGCVSLSSVSFGKNLSSLGECSFYMCSSLDSVYIPPSVSKIGSCAVGFAPSSGGISKLDDFVIFGDRKSAVRKYADENSITFENAEDSVHAVAIQRISGQRIYVPSVTLIFAAVIIFILAIVRKKLNKI